MGCSKVLDITPQNSLTFKNGLESPADFEAALRGCGQNMLSVVRDVQILQQTKGEYADTDLNTSPQRYLSPALIVQGRWQSHYTVIAQANVVLKYADKAAITDERRKLYKGQAYFYKAVAYYELIRSFGDCIIVPDEVTPDPLNTSPWTQVADVAIDLAQKAVDNLPEFDQVKDHTGASARYKSEPAKGPANALLANLCAWKAGCKYFATEQNYDENALWDRAEKAATAVIGSGQYSLAATPEEVVTSVLVGDSRESIYETVFKDFWNEIPALYQTTAFQVGHIYHRWPMIPNSSPTDHPAFRILNSTVRTLYPGNDTRKNSYFYMFNKYDSLTYFLQTLGYAYPYKLRKIYVATTGFQAGQFVNFNVNRVWWRLADIILLRAECRARRNNTAGAVADLNTIRARAGAIPYDPSEYNGDLRYTVFKERQKEFLLEGYRYFDVIRNGYARTELLGGFRTASDQDFKDGAFFLAISPSVFPVPEFTTNPLLRQNKYWSKYL